MKIILLRHGEPDMTAWSRRKRLSAEEFWLWVDAYNWAPLVEAVEVEKSASDKGAATGPDTALKELASSADFLVCSSLRRSIDSAELLQRQPDIMDPLFREAELPAITWRWLKLSANAWLLLSRLLWFLGASKHVESFALMRRRASLAAAQLIAYGAEHQQIVVVGHGLFNRFLAKALIAGGMRGPKKTASHYWQYSLYEK